MSASELKKKLYFRLAGYFRFFANIVYQRWHPRVIAVTGSAGKTTMLSMLEHEIGDKAHYSHNANSAFGVSFDILGLKGVRGSKLRWAWLIIAAPVLGLFMWRRKPFYVVEIDGERPHEAEFLAKWLKPEVTIWVSIGLSHAVQFEKVVNSGEYKDLSAAITAEFANLPANTTKRVYHFSTPQPKDIAFNLFVLADLMKYLKLPFKTDFSDLKVEPGRSSHFKGVKGIDIVDASYNAHMISMTSTLDMAKRMHADHLWLVIGDIVDQGSLEADEHRKLAELIAAVRPEKVVLVGRRTKEHTAPRLKELGVSAVATTDPRKALSYIEKHITGKETLIFKGSQYLEWIIEKLLADPADAAKLCRREKAAVERRKKWGLD